MTSQAIRLAKEVGRVPSSVVPLGADEEKRYQRLVEETVMVDVHQHPFVLPEDMDRFIEHLRGNRYRWGYEAVKQGGWAAVATANVFRAGRGSGAGAETASALIRFWRHRACC
jgi:hypothetical protein